MEPVLALLPARPLVQGGQVGVHIAGIAPAAGHFLPGGGNLPQSVGVVGDVGQDDQHVHILLKGQVLRGGQGHAGGGDALHRRVVGQVHKQHRPVDGAGAPGSSSIKKSDSSKVMPMAANTTAKWLVRAPHLGLAGDLGRQLGVGQAAEPEKMGSFCPRTRVFSPSMAETPVWINSWG